MTNKEKFLIGIIITILIVIFTSCSKQKPVTEVNTKVKGFGTTFVLWNNQTDIAGGFVQLYKNSVLAATSNNTGVTTKGNFAVMDGDIIFVNIVASAGEVTPFGVQTKLKVFPYTPTFIPGSFQVIPGGGNGTYTFTIDSTYNYDITWGIAP